MAAEMGKKKCEKAESGEGGMAGGEDDQ